MGAGGDVGAGGIAEQEIAGGGGRGFGVVVIRRGGVLAPWRRGEVLTLHPVQEEHAGGDVVIADCLVQAGIELEVVILAVIQEAAVGEIADARAIRAVGDGGRTGEWRLRGEALNGDTEDRAPG